MTEIAPGIHRIESVLGPRPFAQYLLRGERTLLVDTGIVTTPEEVILPWLRERGIEPASLDLVLISHADVDHMGGNAAIKSAAPGALFCAHEADTPWISSKEHILAERYGWYAEHGPAVDYDPDTKGFLPNGMGEDVRVDIQLQGGERFQLGDGLCVDVLHLPGHSDGHIGLWEPESRTAIVIDAVLGGGLIDFDGKVIQPPPYFDAVVYEATIAELQSLNPQRLLTAHYPVMEGEQVKDFLDLSLGFVTVARAAVMEALERRGWATLGELLQDLDPVLGPFTSFANELAGTIRSHVCEMVESGGAREIEGTRPLAWEWTG